MLRCSVCVITADFFAAILHTCRIRLCKIVAPARFRRFSSSCLSARILAAMLVPGIVKEIVKDDVKMEGYDMAEPTRGVASMAPDINIVARGAWQTNCGKI